MTQKSFRTEIELGGKTATGFAVPVDVVESFGMGKKPRVSVTINDHTYRSTVAVYGGVPMLPLSAANRAAAGVRAGDLVTVTLVADTEERTVDLPQDLEAALNSAGLRERFDALSYSKRRERAAQVGAAKGDDTRRRRIAKIVAELSNP